MPGKRDIRPRRHPVVGVLAVRGISKTALAHKIGVNPAFLAPALNGRTPLSPRLRARIAEVLQLPEAKLFHDEPPVFADTRVKP